MPDQLLYHILNSDKKPQYLNRVKNVESGEGVLKTDGTPAHLQSSPTGWTETLVKWTRNNKYLGLFRDFSVPLKFVNDGAKILRNAMWRTLGMEAVLYLTISKLNPNVFPDTYDSWYAGELDFSKFRQTRAGVEIQMVEGGLSKLLKAYESTTYEVDVHNDLEKFDLYLDGLTFANKVEWTIYGDQEHLSADMLIGCGIISQEGTTQGIAVNDGEFTDGTHIPNKWITQVINKDITMNYDVSMTFQMYGTAELPGNVGHINIRMNKYDRDNNFVATYDFLADTVFPPGNASFSHSLSIPVSDGENIYFDAGGGGKYTILSGSVKLNYLVRFSPTLCECMSWMTLFERLTTKLTSGKYGCKSTFLPTLTDQCVTSGQAIRQYRSEAVIKTSMNDFFQACKRWGVGMGIENDRLVIETHDYFFKNGIATISLADVTDEDFDVAEDLVFNTIKVGYPNQTYDNVNGKDEFNVTQQYTTPHTRIVRELDLTCPYRADMFGIELTRINLFQKDTTDNKADNDTFIMNVTKGTDYDYYRGTFTTEFNEDSVEYFIHIPSVLFDLPTGRIIRFNSTNYTIVYSAHVLDGITTIKVVQPVTDASFNEAIVTHDDNVYKLNRPAFTSVTGLVNPAQAFNVLLSPKSIIENNSAYIHSVLDLQDANKIIFQTGEKNSLMSYTLAGKTVTQNADIGINTLKPKLFKPYYFKFKTKVPLSLPTIMKNNPYDKVSFDYLGNTYSGFVWDAGMEPALNAAQEFQLLSSPTNDLTKLV